MLIALSLVAAVAVAVAAYLVLGRLGPLDRSRAQLVAVAVAVGGAATALASGAAPTGHPVLDGVYRALFGAGVVVAASRARRWAWLVASGLAVVLDHGSVMGIVSGAALGLSLGSAASRRPGRAVGALVGLGVGQGLLYGRWAHPVGSSAVVAAVAVVVLAWSHLSVLRSRTRRRVGLAAGAGAGLVVLVGAVYGLSAFSVRHAVQAGLADADAALAAAQAGRSASSGADLQGAVADLDRVHSRVGAWWDRPATALPALAQNARAVQVAVAGATSVLGQATHLLGTAHLKALEVSHGTVDLARLTALTPQVQASHRAVDTARNSIAATASPWLLGPLADKLHQLSARLATASSATGAVLQATRDLPGILGADGPRRWLLAVLDNSELRGGGGLLADVGVLTTDRGHVSLSALEPTPSLEASHGGVPVSGPADYMARYGWLQPGVSLVDDFHSPDFPSDAPVVQQVYDEVTGTRTTGVVAVDAFALADLLRLTGPVSVAGWPEPITTANAVPVLLHDQYDALSGKARDDFLVDLGHKVFDTLASRSLPGPAVLGTVLGPAAVSHHIQLYSPHLAEEALFDRVGASGRMPATAGDFLEVADHNFSLDKDDWYLTRAITYDVSFNRSTGVESASLVVRLHNTSPASGEPAYILGGARTPPGYDEQWVCVYSPLALSAALADGRPASLTRQGEAGRNVYCGFLTVPPGGTSMLSMQLYGSLSGLAGAPYRLIIGYQATPHPDAVGVKVTTSPNGSTRRWSAEMTGPASLGP